MKYHLFKTIPHENKDVKIKSVFLACENNSSPHHKMPCVNQYILIVDLMHSIFYVSIIIYITGDCSYIVDTLAKFLVEFWFVR